MKLQGIKIHQTPKGKIKQITINTKSKTSLIDDLVDTIIYESCKDEPTTPWEQVKKEIELMHANK